MPLNLVNLAPLLALIAGVVVLVMPRALHIIVAVYLILYGAIGLAKALHLI